MLLCEIYSYSSPNELHTVNLIAHQFYLAILEILFLYFLLQPENRLINWECLFSQFLHLDYLFCHGTHLKLIFKNINHNKCNL